MLKITKLLHSDRGRYLRRGMLTLACGFLVTISNGQGDQRIRLNGFGDMTFGANFGDPASAVADSMFSLYGEDADPKNLNQGFGIVGTDFVVTATITEDLTYQGEVNLQVGRGGTSDIELDFERVYLDYKISDKFNLQGGLFFTPIGFSNRNLYARAWLMNSVQVRSIVEEEHNMVPTHDIGINAYGTFDLGTNGMALNYIFSACNGRGIDPTQAFYARDMGGKQYTGLLELNIPKGEDFRIGLSGYYNNDIQSFRIDSIGGSVDMSDPSSEAMVLSEMGLNPYIWFKSKAIQLFAESHMVTWNDELGNLADPSTSLFAFTGELAINLKLKEKRFAPYIRYDYTKLPTNGGPYLGLRQDGDMLTRIYVPEFNAFMIGAAYDLNSFNRIKIEYIMNMDGPRQQHGISFQTAFGF